jgi:hypothetical protein
MQRGIVIAFYRLHPKSKGTYVGLRVRSETVDFGPGEGRRDLATAGVGVTIRGLHKTEHGPAGSRDGILNGQGVAIPGKSVLKSLKKKVLFLGMPWLLGTYLRFDWITQQQRG